METLKRKNIINLKSLYEVYSSETSYYFTDKDEAIAFARNMFESEEATARYNHNWHLINFKIVVYELDLTTAEFDDDDEENEDSTFVLAQIKSTVFELDHKKSR